MGAAQGVRRWQDADGMRTARVRAGPDLRRTVVVADAQPTFRVGTGVALHDEGFAVLAQVASASDAVMTAISRRPDACVLAGAMGDGALEAVRTISTVLPGTVVLVLADDLVHEEMLAALRAGASAYLPRSTPPSRLCAAIRAALAGDVAIPRPLVRSLVDVESGVVARNSPLSVSGRRVQLTPRESQVVELLRRGLCTRTMATQLGISVVTVRRHLSEALRKLGATDRGAAVGLLNGVGGGNPAG